MTLNRDASIGFTVSGNAWAALITLLKRRSWAKAGVQNKNQHRRQQRHCRLRDSHFNAQIPHRITTLVRVEYSGSPRGVGSLPAKIELCF